MQIYFSCLRWISPGDEYDFTSNQAIAILNKNKLSYPFQKCLAIWNVMKMRMIGWMTPGDGLPHRTLHQSPIHSLNILGFFYSSCQCSVSSRMWKVNFSLFSIVFALQLVTEPHWLTVVSVVTNLMTGQNHRVVSYLYPDNADPAFQPHRCSQVETDLWWPPITRDPALRSAARCTCLEPCVLAMRGRVAINKVLNIAFWANS